MGKQEIMDMIRSGKPEIMECYGVRRPGPLCRVAVREIGSLLIAAEVWHRQNQGHFPYFLLLSHDSDSIIRTMPRIARIVAPGYPHHITQRGNNRATVFFDDEDRQTYLKLLAKHAQKYHVSIWAYCLMSNHIHLLAAPETETGLSRGIGLTNLMYTQYINRKQNQSGRIWQNRFFSCVIESDRCLWAVARYIERNPLKVGLAASAESYRWSSAKAHITGIYDPMLDSVSWLLPQEQKAYAEFVREEDEETDNAIRRATRTGRPFGTEQFIDQLESRLNQTVRPGKPGRPRSKTGKCP